jgi:hypothetical protein
MRRRRFWYLAGLLIAITLAIPLFSGCSIFGCKETGDSCERSSECCSGFSCTNAGQCFRSD